jgi:6-phospho-beta-glucosidase
LNYVFHPDKMLAKKMGKRTRAEELIELQDELLSEFETTLADGEKPAGLARRKARWYEAIIAPVIVALAEKRTETFITNLINGNILPWLPPQSIIEVPTLFEGGRLHPLAVTATVPAEVKALVQANCAYEMLAVESIVERDRAKALKALLLNPIIRTYDQAVQTLDQAWKQPGA